jgi:hypothetical protein
MIAGRKPIACWPETNLEGGVESTSRGDARKDQQRTVGDKAGAKELGSALKTEGKSLNENPKGGTHTKCQTTNKPNKQKMKKNKNKNGEHSKEERDRR